MARTGVFLAVLFFSLAQLPSLIRSEAVVCFDPLPPLEFTSSSRTQVLVMKNNGDTKLDISQVSLRDNLAGGFFKVEALQLPASIVPQQTLNITVSYAPGASSPPNFNVLEITTNSNLYKVVSVVLRGVDDALTAAPQSVPVDMQPRLAVFNYDAEVFPPSEPGVFLPPVWTRPGFWNDFLVFNKITGGMYDAPTNFRFLNHDQVVIRVANIHPSSDLVIEKMSISSPKFVFVGDVTNASFPMTILPGHYVNFTIGFIENTGEKGIRLATLAIQSNDVTNANVVLQLSGAYMTWREDTNELSWQQIVNAFGYTSYIYHESELGFDSFPERWTAALIGEEVRSRKWERADLNKPVYVRSLAAFLLVIKNAPEPETFTVLGEGGGQISIDPRYGQSFLPLSLAKNGLPTEGNFTTTGTFATILSHNFDTKGGNAWTSDDGNWINMHFVPLRDRRGVMLKDTFVIGHDFILPRGCCKGAGCANCDYNDNIYLISNVKPSDASVYIPSYDVGAPELVLNFDTAYPAETLADKNGVPTGFITTVANDLDTKWGSNSYNPKNLEIDTTAKTFTITSLLGGGNNQGAINRLVNSMALVFNSDQFNSYIVSATLKGPFTLSAEGQETGMMLGTTKDTYGKLSLFFDPTAGVVLQFVLEQQSRAAAPAYAVLPNPGSINTLELIVIANPQTAMLVPMYRIDGGAPTLILSAGGVRVRDPHYGMFFGPRCKLSVFAAHSGSATNVFTSTFTHLSVESLAATSILSASQKNSDLLASSTGFNSQPANCFPPPPVEEPPVEIPVPSSIPSPRAPSSSPLAPQNSATSSLVACILHLAAMVGVAVLI